MLVRSIRAPPSYDTTINYNGKHYPILIMVFQQPNNRLSCMSKAESAHVKAAAPPSLTASYGASSSLRNEMKSALPSFRDVLINGDFTKAADARWADAPVDAPVDWNDCLKTSTKRKSADCDGNNDDDMDGVTCVPCVPSSFVNQSACGAANLDHTRPQTLPTHARASLHKFDGNSMTPQQPKPLLPVVPVQSALQDKMRELEEERDQMRADFLQNQSQANERLEAFKSEIDTALTAQVAAIRGIQGDMKLTVTANNARMDSLESLQKTQFTQIMAASKGNSSSSKDHRRRDKSSESDKNSKKDGVARSRSSNRGRSPSDKPRAGKKR
jgi:hypothetical protein